MKRSAKYHTTEDSEEKKRLKRGKVDGYRGKPLIICLPHSHLQCLIIYRPKKTTCILPPIPNYLTTYQLHYICYSLFGEYDGAEGVEKRGLEGVWRGALWHQCLIIYRPIFLFFRHSRWWSFFHHFLWWLSPTTYFYYSSFDEWGRCGEHHSKTIKTTQNSVEKVAMWSRWEGWMRWCVDKVK